MTLITTVILLIFASVVVLGVTIFVLERLSLAEINFLRAKTIDLAHAGLNHAIYFFRFRDLTANGYFSLGQTNIDANNYFVLSASAADLLMVDTSAAALGGPNNRALVGLRIQNATNSQTITIDRMIISWVKPAPARYLRRIIINGSRVWNSNAKTPPPVNADLRPPNFTLNTTPTIYPITAIRFSGNMRGTTDITIEFVMTDGSRKTVRAYPASANNNFTVNATGQVTNSSMKRRLRVEYNAIPAQSRIINYHEIAPTP